MKRTIFAWIIFFCGVGVEMMIDHMLRMQDGDVQTGGIPEPLLFFLQIVMAAVSLWQIYIATQSIAAWWKRMLIVVMQAIAGFLLYAVMGLYYVVGTGIDTL